MLKKTLHAYFYFSEDAVDFFLSLFSMLSSVYVLSLRVVNKVLFPPCILPLLHQTNDFLRNAYEPNWIYRNLKDTFCAQAVCLEP